MAVPKINAHSPCTIEQIIQSQQVLSLTQVHQTLAQHQGDPHFRERLRGALLASIRAVWEASRQNKTGEQAVIAAVSKMSERRFSLPEAFSTDMIEMVRLVDKEIRQEIKKKNGGKPMPGLPADLSPGAAACTFHLTSAMIFEGFGFDPKQLRFDSEPYYDTMLTKFEAATQLEQESETDWNHIANLAALLSMLFAIIISLGGLRKASLSQHMTPSILEKPWGPI